MATGQKLIQTIELSYTTNVVDIATMTSLAALSQEMNYIHVYDTSGSRGQILDASSKVLLNYPAGGLPGKETLRLETGEVLYVKAKGQSMTSGHLTVEIYGG